MPRAGMVQCRSTFSSRSKRKSAGLETSVEELKEDPALLKGLVEHNRELLLTPRGQREGFSLK